MNTPSDAILFARLDALIKPLADFPAIAQYIPADAEWNALFENLARQLNEVCFLEPGIGNPQYADQTALKAAQLEPARQFRRWLAGHLAATDWADVRQARATWLLWDKVINSWAFSYWGLARLLPGEDGGLAEAVAGLLTGPNHELENDVRLSDVLYAVLEQEAGQGGHLNLGMVQQLPQLLRFGPGSNAGLRLLPLHPDAAEEVPRLLRDAFVLPAAAWVASYVAAWLREAPVVKLLKPALPRLRHYLGQLTQPQLAELVRALDEKCQRYLNAKPGENIHEFANSPNRLLVLKLLTELVTEPALSQRLQASLSRARSHQQKQRDKAPTGRKIPPKQLVDFNLKLLVISQLLRQGHAFPALAATLDRTPDYDDFSYAPVPAALAAYRRLRLSQADYDAVEELEPDAGDIHDLNLINNWDGEDDQFDVRSLQGIGLLRNLRRFVPYSLLAVNDFTPLLDCPHLAEAGIADLAGADSAVALALEARGVRVF